MNAIVTDRAAVADPTDAPEDVRKRRAPLTKKHIFIGAAVLIVVAAGADWGRWQLATGRFLQSTDDAYVGGDITPMAPKVAGFITEIDVADNQAVKAGDVLLRIDDRPYKAELARAEASVAAQQATIADLDATRRLQEAVLNGARADEAAAAAQTAFAADDYARYKALTTNAYASRQRFEQADADYKKAVAAQAKTQAAIDAGMRQLDVIDAQKEQTAAALDVARAERDIAQLDVGYTELRAPVDGMIGNRSAQVGSYATVGAALLSVVPTKGLWVDANFKESQLAKIRAGQTVAIEADVLPGETFKGRVASLAPATGAEFSVLPAENATGNFTKIVQRVPVRILLDSDDGALGRLRPGLSVTATVDDRLNGSDALPVGAAQ